MQENGSVNVVNLIIEYIEENIQKQISLEDISNYVNISKHHLHRLFKALTDKKLMNYVNNRKLTHSIDRLLNTSLRIIDIANDYNFEYEQSYIRAFTRAFGISPDEFRKKKCSITITDKINPNRYKPIGIDGIFFEPETVFKPSFKIVGIKHHHKLEENREVNLSTNLGNDFFYNHRFEIKNAKFPNVYIGLVDHLAKEPEYINYTTALEVMDFEDIPGGMMGYTVPTHRYAVFKYIGLHHPGNTTAKDISSIYKCINNWQDISNYYIADSYHFERVDVDISSDDYCEVEFHFPVERKQLENSSQTEEYTKLYKAFFIT